MLYDFFHPKMMLNLKTYILLDPTYPFHLLIVPGSCSDLPATDISLILDMHTTLEIVFASYLSIWHFTVFFLKILI